MSTRIRLAAHCLLLIGAAGFSTGCANERRTPSGRKLELQMVTRPNRQPTFLYRPVDER